MKAKILKLSFIFFFALTMLTASSFVFAQSPDLGVDYASNLNLSDGGGTDARTFIINIVRYALTFLGIIAVVMIMYGGFIWMTANGQADRVEKAKKILIGAVIGLVIILSAFAIVTYVVNITNTALEGGGCTPGATASCGCNGSGSKICGADGTWGSCSASCGAGETCCSFGCASDCSTPPEFFTKNTIPSDGDVNVIKNVKISYTFSRSILASSYADAKFTVTDVATGLPIAGSRVASGNRITFTPSAACDTNPCGATNCFTSGTQVRVAAEDGAAGILSIGDIPLSCPGTGLDCQIEFTVGDTIDCDKPKVKLDFNQICAINNNELYAYATDNSGISQLEFFVDGMSISDPSNPVPASGNKTFNSRSASLPVWWDASSFAANTPVSIKVTANDIDSKSESDTKTYLLRPGHCCNNLKDDLQGETGIDCGGECAACEGASCGINLSEACGAGNTNCDDTKCAGGLCACGGTTEAECTAAGYKVGISNCCLCEDAPIIDAITPTGGFCKASPNTYCGTDDSICSALLPGDTCDLETANASAGSLVTISGRYFGSYSAGISKIEFDGVPADLADTVNPACNKTWTNNQIIAVLPNGLGVSPEIKITAASGFYDTNQDARGAEIDFLVNNISRPGLCSLSPDNGVFNTAITFQGIRLNAASAFFGSYAANVPALNSVFAGATNGTASVPNINTGKKSVFVKTSGVNSNYLYFTKNKEAESGPYITSFSPVSGPEGQYVTILGGGFGSAQKLSKIYFDLDLSDNAGGDPSKYGKEADYSFPDECKNNIWGNNQILIKVPKGMPSNDSDYYIVIYLSDAKKLIDTTGAFLTGPVADPTFHYNSALPLAPSLCRIDPVRGTNNSELSLWGEYFGTYDPSGASKVRFYDNKDQQGSLSASGPIISWDVTGKTNKIKAIVHSSAMSGPVKVVKNNTLEGNGLSFFIGGCKANQDCDNGGTAGVCCPLDSTQSGRCATDANTDGNINIADCYGTLSASVYEWEFTSGGQLACDGDTTNAVCDADDSFCSSLGTDWTCNTTTCVCEKTDITDSTDSCQGRAQRTNACDPLACPNSSGFCSPYSGGNSVASGIACTNDICVMPGCSALTCSYSSLADKCINNAIVCSKSAVDSLGKNTQAYCATYNGVNRWHINTQASCPTNWKNIGNSKCIDESTVCSLCPLGLSCQDINSDGNGECISALDICPSNTVCDAGVCTSKDSAVCECCCRLPQGSDNYDSQDCCSGLKCAGNCGNDRITDTDQTGYCTGCRVESGSVVDVAASDAACNCTGASGKFCDTEYEVNGVKVGACKDCSQLAGNTSTCSDHSSACCVDGKSANNCRGIGDGSAFVSGMINYCTYYDCTLPQKDSCDITPKINGQFNYLSNCVSSCKGNATDGLGTSCQSEKIDEFGACNNGLCANPFQCLNSSGTSNFSDGCGVCCCDPNAAADECTEAGLSLKCVADKAPCAGADRGLCCGCESDANCVASGLAPSGVGCGTDTCCHARPNVESTNPLDNSEQICRNSEIVVNFDQLMDVGSFNGNVILVGDYGFDACPAGTEYLAAAGRMPTKKNFIAKVYLKAMEVVKRIINPFSAEDNAMAYYAVEAGHNFCAVSGQASGYNNAADKGVLIFKHNRLLDGNRRYYAIIKGDKVLNDAQSEGVKSNWGIGMNGGMNETFNGISYANSHIFSFTTLPEQSANNGVCIVDHIDIDPESYLFQTNENDQTDDNSRDNKYDTIKDSDKVFMTYARTLKGQVLSPIPNIYDWSIVWTTSNYEVADFVPTTPPVTGEKQLIRAGTRKTEGYTQISAVMQYAAGNTIIGPMPAPSGTSDVYLFVCKNPWPPIESDGTWRPWQDQDNNCSIVDAGCDNYNYKLYYCRDAGSPGTYDDLPAIKSGYRATDPNRVIRGKSLFLSCSTTGDVCPTYGDPCGPGSSGICQSNYLKEVYFFREDVPTATTSFSVLNSADGQTVRMSWEKVGGVDGYKLYWGTRMNNYDDYAEVYNDATDDKNNVTCTLVGDTYTCDISGLKNDTKYYFNLTSFLNTGTESAYFGEKSVQVTDEVSPEAPINFMAIPLDKQVKLSWNPVTGASGYKVYYGVVSGIYGGAKEVGSETEIIISGLNNGSTYYFAVSAYDKKNNESPRSLEKSAVPASSQCGNGVCNDGECTANCADCNLSKCCGIEGCNAGIGETTVTCPGDCNVVPPPPPPPILCGNGTCDFGENATNCASDCGSGSTCGNGVCNAGECTSGCVSDCNVSKCCGIEGCNAGVGETSSNCNSDCGGTIPPPPPPPPPG